MPKVEPYRIGWWTHRWWPTKELMRCLVTGNQPSARADNGCRFVGRKAFVGVVLRRLKLVRRPHRPWQAEAHGLQFARRSFTAEGAARKMQMDLDHATGVVTGCPIDSPWQLRRLARANVKAIKRAKRSASAQS